MLKVVRVLATLGVILTAASFCAAESSKDGTNASSSCSDSVARKLCQANMDVKSSESDKKEEPAGLSEKCSDDSANDLASKVGLLSNEIRAHPADPALLIERAKIYRLAKKFGEEENDIRRALALEEPGAKSPAREYLIHLISKDFRRGMFFGVKAVRVRLGISQSQYNEPFGLADNKTIAAKFGLDSAKLKSWVRQAGLIVAADKQSNVLIEFAMRSLPKKAGRSDRYQLAMQTTIGDCDCGATTSGGIDPVEFSTGTELRMHILKISKDFAQELQSENDSIEEKRIDTLIKLREESVFRGLDKVILSVETQRGLKWQAQAEDIQALKMTLLRAGIRVLDGSTQTTEELKVPRLTFLLEEQPGARVVSAHRKIEQVQFCWTTRLRQPDASFNEEHSYCWSGNLTKTAREMLIKEAGWIMEHKRAAGNLFKRSPQVSGKFNWKELHQQL